MRWQEPGMRVHVCMLMVFSEILLSKNANFQTRPQTLNVMLPLKANILLCRFFSNSVWCGNSHAKWRHGPQFSCCDSFPTGRVLLSIDVPSVPLSKFMAHGDVYASCHTYTLWWSPSFSPILPPSLPPSFHQPFTYQIGSWQNLWLWSACIVLKRTANNRLQQWSWQISEDMILMSDLFVTVVIEWPQNGNLGPWSYRPH